MALAVGSAATAELAVLGAMAGGPVAFTVSFMLFFSIVIALFKDIPDVKVRALHHLPDADCRPMGASASQ